MKTSSQTYSLFFKFIQAYSPVNFQGIDRNDPLILEIEEMMENNNQFFFIGDIIHVKIFFVSKRSTQIMGIEPEDLTPYHFFEATHPDDIQRHNLARSKLFKLANDLFIAEKGLSVLSTNFKIRNPFGKYSSLLFQCYLFFSSSPYKTVYDLQIHTNIDRFKKIKHGYHYDIRHDLSHFKYPDEELLMTGNIFTDREFEIIRLIASGLSSEQIAEKLFISQHTVHTHRRNMLEKTGKLSLSDVIYDLMERGLL